MQLLPQPSDVITKVRADGGLHDCVIFSTVQRYARTMSSQTLPRPKRAGTSKRKTRKTGWLAWWPLLAGVAITFAAVKTAEILPLMGAAGLLKLRLLYPYALLLKQPQLGLTEQSSDSWSQIMLYAQWVLYGLYATVATKRMPLWKVLMQIAVVHLLGFSVLWLLAR
jgi:hypothetical protein